MTGPPYMKLAHDWEEKLYVYSEISGYSKRKAYADLLAFSQYFPF